MSSELLYKDSLAIIVATNYSDSPGPEKGGPTPLSCPESDAAALAKVLTSYGFEILDLIGENATADEIRKAFTTIIKPRENPLNRLVVFLAGHGDQFFDKKDWCFCPTDWRAGEDHKLIREQDLHGWLNVALERSFKHIFLIVDACYAGSIFRSLDVQTLRDSPRPEPVEYYVKTRMEFEALQVLTAGGSKEAIYDCKSPGKKHSAMVSVLLKGLTGKPNEAMVNDILSANSLGDYVIRRVREEYRGVQQIPLYWVERGGREGDMILFLAPTPNVPRLVEAIKPVLVRLESGDYPIGCDPSDPDCFESTEGKFDWWRLKTPIWVGKYPVTIGEYNRFIEDGGYTDDALWRDYVEDQVWWQKFNKSRPTLPILTGSDDNPVGHITWFEARAYCNWLSRKLNHEFRLLKEAEWEAACRGKYPKRRFPWEHLLPGQSEGLYTPTRAEIVERCQGWVTGIPPFDPVSVKKFDGKGTSWCGCEDMVGNIHEWTSSLYKEYPYKNGDGREDLTRPGERVLRGGSLEGDRAHLRCSYRRASDPWTSYYAFGFRLATDKSFKG